MRLLRAVTLMLVSVAAVHAARLAAQQAGAPSGGSTQLPNPLATELERCKALREQASVDERCEAAYKESRRLFFQPPRAYRPVTIDMFPETQKEPWSTDVKPKSAATDK
jgi:conjugative transfer region protein TrbK